MKNSFTGVDDARAFRQALLGKLRQTRTIILVDFSEIEYLDDFALATLLAVTFVASHRGSWLGFFGLNEAEASQLKAEGLGAFLYAGGTSAEAYEELCTRRKEEPIGDEPPSFDILQFVREEVEASES